MLDDKTLDSFPCAPYDWPWGDANSAGDNSSHVWAHGVSTSGGYAEFIFQQAAKELFNAELETLEFKTLRYDHISHRKNLLFSFLFIYQKSRFS